VMRLCLIDGAYLQITASTSVKRTKDKREMHAGKFKCFSGSHQTLLIRAPGEFESVPDGSLFGTAEKETCTKSAIRRMLRFDEEKMKAAPPFALQQNLWTIEWQTTNSEISIYASKYPLLATNRKVCAQVVQSSHRS